MRSFMDYLQYAFYESSKWDIDNSYASLHATPRALLFFDTPKGLRLNVSALATPNFAHTYALGSLGLVNGSLSYLYSSLPVARPSSSVGLDLRDVIEGYRHVAELRAPEQIWSPQKWRRALTGRKDTLLYGRFYLPQSLLEAMYLRRISPTTQIRLTCVSDRIFQSASVLAVIQRDVGKYSAELLYSTDSALFGLRGLYNFGPDPRDHSVSNSDHEPNTANSPSHSVASPNTSSPDQYNGRFSAGAEVYYGLLNKSGGLSTGLRFTTLPSHTGFPYTMTVTLNPLMGNVSSSYAVKAGRNISLCSQFDFNFYSYESDLRLGCEIWRAPQRKDTDWADRMLRADWKRAAGALMPAPDSSGVFKARCDQNWNVGLLWQGRLQELLFSVGVSFDFLRREQIFKAVGAELQYSS